MVRVTALYVRSDWALIRFLYVPLLLVGLVMLRLPARIIIDLMRLAPCGICLLISRWAYELDGWLHHKPMLQIMDQGLVHQDDSDWELLSWTDIVEVTLRRRDPILPWRGFRSIEIAPACWLMIVVRDDVGPENNPVSMDGYVVRQELPIGDNDSTPGGGYVVPYDERPADPDPDPDQPVRTRTICVWPRQVQGGLWSLVRFAKELQRNLIAAADRGEITNLLPPAERHVA